MRSQFFFPRLASSPEYVPTTVREPPVGEKPSRSDQVPQPTRARDAVADLHAVLSSAHEPGPYVFVGQSYGGLIARLYASTYRKDISGLVLVDALSEGLRDQRRLDNGRYSES